MTELYRARLEADKLRASLADAQAECQRVEDQLDRMRSMAQKDVVSIREKFDVSIHIIFGPSVQKKHCSLSSESVFGY